MGKDDAGMTRAEAEAISIEEVYALYAERYTRLQEMLRDAQLVISDGPWGWIGAGLLPNGGNETAYRTPTGMTVENSYLLDDARTIQPPGAKGDEADLEPMRKHFAAQGWRIQVRNDFESSTDLLGWSEDGFCVEYTVRTNGNYSLSVYSGSYWGPGKELLVHLAERLRPELILRESVPGEWIPLPAWDAPVVNPVRD
ncbi:hypothetical protein [Leifsonia sp. NPDC077715]|uniref:hypothetical protein n=1 Tax=Leifsonia sp. NPDC077715 TaxID=3155539 RepID=UPI003434BB4E